jgi:hypothetical protein
VWYGRELDVLWCEDEGRIRPVAGSGAVTVRGGPDETVFVGHPLPKEWNGQTLCVTANVTFTQGSAYLALLRHGAERPVLIGETRNVSATENGVRLADTIVVPGDPPQGACAEYALAIGVAPMAQVKVNAIRVRVLEFDEVKCPE